MAYVVIAYDSDGKVLALGTRTGRLFTSKEAAERGVRRLERLPGEQRFFAAPVESSPA